MQNERRIGDNSNKRDIYLGNEVYFEGGNTLTKIFSNGSMSMDISQMSALEYQFNSRRNCEIIKTTPIWNPFGSETIYYLRGEVSIIAHGAFQNGNRYLLNHELLSQKGTIQQIEAIRPEFEQRFNDIQEKGKNFHALLRSVWDSVRDKEDFEALVQSENFKVDLTPIPVRD